MTSPPDESAKGLKKHLFLVSCSRIIHSSGKPITYLFAVNAHCPPEALIYENWGLVELVDVAQTDILRGELGVARTGLQARVPEREWSISVGNAGGILFHESLPEGGWDESELTEVIARIPSGVVIIEKSLVSTFSMACNMAHISYSVHQHKGPLCADCIKFGCEGSLECDQRSADEKQEILKGKRFELK